MTQTRCISLYLLFALVYIYRIRYVKADVFAECENVPDETFVPSSTSCRSYIYCLGDESSMGDCDVDEYFNSETESCEDADSVVCLLDIQEQLEAGDEEEDAEEADVDAEDEDEEEQEAEVPEEEEEEPEEPEEPQEPEQPASVQPITTTKAPTTKAPIQTSPEPVGTTVTTPSSNFDSLNKPPIVRDICPNVDDPNQIVLMANRESCSDFYLCYHGSAIEMHCTSHLHFNINTGKCDFPEHVKCAIERPAASKCLPHITDFFPHPDKCNYFYYCIHGFLTVQQCPFYYGWDIEKRSCVHISNAKCYNNTKRI